MVYNVTGILRDARVALDRNGDDRDLLPVDVNTRLLDEVVMSVVEDAARGVENGAPVELLDNARVISCGDAGVPSIRWSSPGGGTVCGSIVLPSDFMRLVAFRMSDWERSVYDIVTEGCKEYQMQSSRFAGVRGTPQRPVAAVVRTGYGQELEFYSCRDDGAEIDRALYLPYPRVDAFGGIDIAERCYRAVVLTVAAMALGVSGEAERGQAYYDMAKQALV